MKTVADHSKAYRNRRREKLERYEAALREIAACESRFPGDVVDIARRALA